MVTYQLDETVYSTGPASSTSHSSPKRPQLEKTVFSSVNNTNNSVRKSINLGKNNSSVSVMKGKNKTSVGSPENTLEIPEKRDFQQQQNIGISVMQEKGEEISLDHHSKKTRSEGSSLKEIRASDDIISNNISKSSVTGEGKQDLPGFNNELKENLSSQNITGNGSESNSEEPVLKRRRGELRDPEGRQNDGTYEPMGGLGCGAMTLLFAREGEQTPLEGQDITKYDIFDDDDDDKGIRKLRTILREAQQTIEKFQVDFQIDDSFRKNKPPLKLWERLQKEDFEEDEMSGTLATGINSSVSSDFELNSKLKNTETEEHSEISLSHDIDTVNVTDSHHRIRHQHQKSIRSKHNDQGGLSKGDPKTVKRSDIVPTSSHAPPSTSPISSEEITAYFSSVEPEVSSTAPGLPTSATENYVGVNDDTTSKHDIPHSRQIKKDNRMEKETTTIKSTSNPT